MDARAAAIRHIAAPHADPNELAAKARMRLNVWGKLIDKVLHAVYALAVNNNVLNI